MVGIDVHQELPGFFPDEEQHGESHSRNTQKEEIERSASKDTVHSRDVEQEDEEDGFYQDSEEHVVVDC